MCIRDRSLNEPIQSEDEDYIMRKIREDYLSDSTVTICLIGTQSAENSPNVDQTYIKRELQASLYNGKNNTRNGILGVVLPDMESKIYQGSYTCAICGEAHSIVTVSYTHLRAHETDSYLVCRLLLEKKKLTKKKTQNTH